MIETEIYAAKVEDLTTPQMASSVPELISPITKLADLDVSESELTSSDLESIAIVYDKIRNLFRSSLPVGSDLQSFEDQQDQ